MSNELREALDEVIKRAELEIGLVTKRLSEIAMSNVRSRKISEDAIELAAKEDGMRIIFWIVKNATDCIRPEEKGD